MEKVTLLVHLWLQCVIHWWK